jgi:hypothetical protein
LKVDPKTYAGNQNQVRGLAASFLAGETVTFCLNAPAGPFWGLVEEVTPSTTEEERTCFWHLQVYDGPLWYLRLEQGAPASTLFPQERGMDIAESIKEVTNRATISFPLVRN